MTQNYAEKFPISVMQIYWGQIEIKYINGFLDWQMLFNVNKCSVLHLGYNNKEYDYKLGCDVIKCSATEKIK